jgi:LytS/YehU family sensor histidine kinase
MMGALGNVFFAISSYLGPIALGIALDFSLIAVLIAGFYGGPTLGLVTGLISGVLPGIVFGPMGSGSWLGLIGLPIGKALTGLTAGLIAKGLNLGQKTRSSLLGIPATLIAYVPEALFTIVYFSYLLPFFIGGILPVAVLITILTKAISEVIIMSVIIAALMGNKGFNDFVRTHFSVRRVTPAIVTTKTAD